MWEGWKPSDDYLGETIQQVMKFEKYFRRSSLPPGKNPGYALGLHLYDFYGWTFMRNFFLWFISYWFIFYDWIFYRYRFHTGFWLPRQRGSLFSPVLGSVWRTWQCAKPRTLLQAADPLQILQIITNPSDICSLVEWGLIYL